MIPAGSILAYQAQIKLGEWSTIDDVVLQMNQTFAQNNIVMRDYHNATSMLDMISSSVVTGAPIQFTATLQTSADFNSAQDIQSIADHAIYLVVGVMPSSTVPGVTVPGSNIATPTGQPNQITPGGTAPAADPFKWLTDMLQGGVNSFALLMVGVILAVVLIIAGKNKAII